MVYLVRGRNGVNRVGRIRANVSWGGENRCFVGDGLFRWWSDGIKGS